MSAPTPTGQGPGHPHPPDWSSSDTVLESEIKADERRLTEDERRIRTNRMLAVGGLALAGLAVAALVLSIIALNRDIEAVAKADPKEGSVGTSAIQDGAVTSDKLAAGAVVNAAIGDAAVGRAKLKPEAVDGSKVAPDSLTGAQINESTLGAVADSKALGGLSAAAFVSGLRVVQAATASNTTELKGPISAACPSGTRVTGGGAAAEGSRDVAIVESAPSGTGAWSAIAEASPSATAAWRLVVTAICAAGGA